MGNLVNNFGDQGNWNAFFQQAPAIQFVETVKEAVSPEFTFAPDGSTATRTLLVAWDNLVFATRAILGYPTIRTVQGVQIVSRALPDAIPYLSNDKGIVWLYATQITRVEGLGVPLDGDLIDPNFASPIARYNLAKLTVQYESLTYDILPDIDQSLVDDGANGLGAGVPDDSTLQRYVTKVSKPNAEYLTLSYGTQGSNFKIVTTGTPAWPGTPGRIVPAFDWSITWHQVPLAAVGSKIWNPNAISFPLDDCLGCVNLTTFPTSNNPWPQGTLLLTGAEIRPIRSALGDRLYDIEYRIKVFNPQGRTDAGGKPIGHNHVYYPGNGMVSAGYYELSTDGTTNIVAGPTNDKNIYNYFEFRKLFRVPD